MYYPSFNLLNLALITFSVEDCQKNALLSFFAAHGGVTHVLCLDLLCSPELSQSIVPKRVTVLSDPDNFTCHSERLIRALSKFAKSAALSPPSWVALFRAKGCDGKSFHALLKAERVIIAPLEGGIKAPTLTACRIALGTTSPDIPLLTEMRFRAFVELKLIVNEIDQQRLRQGP